MENNNQQNTGAPTPPPQGQYTPPQGQYAPPQANQNFQQYQSSVVQDKYHTGFTTLMKINTIVQAFVIPAIIWLIALVTLVNALDDDLIFLFFILCLIGYAATAFTVWFNLSYKTFLFDNVSKIGQGVDQTIAEIQKKK